MATVVPNPPLTPSVLRTARTRLSIPAPDGPAPQEGVAPRSHAEATAKPHGNERSRVQAAAMRACSGTRVPRRRATASTYQILGPARTAEQLGRLAETASARCHRSSATERTRTANKSAFAVVPAEGVKARW